MSRARTLATFGIQLRVSDDRVEVYQVEGNV
jgi:hypothetical protein